MFLYIFEVDRLINRSNFFKTAVFKLIATQICITCTAACFLWLVIGKIAGLSALLGGLICLIPNLYMAYKTFAYSGATAAQKIVNSFYKGEAGKLLLTIAGFSLVFLLVRPLDPLALFLTYVVVQSVFWFTPVLMKTRTVE